MIHMSSALSGGIYKPRLDENSLDWIPLLTPSDDCPIARRTIVRPNSHTTGL